MSDPILDWPGKKTAQEAARYLLTSGLIAVELYRATLERAEKAEARVRELTTALRFYAGRLRADRNGYEFDDEPSGFIGGVARKALGEIPKECKCRSYFVRTGNHADVCPLAESNDVGLEGVR